MTKPVCESEPTTKHTRNDGTKRPPFRSLGETSLLTGTSNGRPLYLDPFTWVFRGTRFPVRAVFENREGGARVEEFLEWFPGVAREQVLAVLWHAEGTLAVPVA